MCHGNWQNSRSVSSVSRRWGGRLFHKWELVLCFMSSLHCESYSAFTRTSSISVFCRAVEALNFLIALMHVLVVLIMWQHTFNAHCICVDVCRLCNRNTWNLQCCVDLCRLCDRNTWNLQCCVDVCCLCNRNTWNLQCYVDLCRLCNRNTWNVQCCVSCSCMPVVICLLTACGQRIDSPHWWTTVSLSMSINCPPSVPVSWCPSIFQLDERSSISFSFQ